MFVQEQSCSAWMALSGTLEMDESLITGDNEVDSQHSISSPPKPGAATPASNPRLLLLFLCAPHVPRARVLAGRDAFAPRTAR